MKNFHDSITQSSTNTRARPSDRASAVFLLAMVIIRWMVPRETPIFTPASSWVKPSRSQSRKASISSRNNSIWSSFDRGVPVGLKALPQKFPSQFLNLFGLGDIINQYLNRETQALLRQPRKRRNLIVTDSTVSPQINLYPTICNKQAAALVMAGSPTTTSLISIHFRQLPC